MSISNSGNIGIGTTNPTEKLEVHRCVYAKKIRVNLIAGADFVFEPDYQLKTTYRTRRVYLQKQAYT